MNSEAEIKILIVDDHPVVRQGLSMMINLKPGLKVLGEACDGVEAVRMAQMLKPDVILMDIVMPNMDGIEAIQAIRRHNPQARILVLTSFKSDDKVFSAIEAGAAGYILKDTQPHELIQAIHNVHQGKAPIDPEVARILFEGLKPAPGENSLDALTEREKDVLHCIVRGLSNKQIAVELTIAVGTVNFHVSNIFQKMGVQNRTQAANLAMNSGLFPPGSD